MTVHPFSPNDKTPWHVGTEWAVFTVNGQPACRVPSRQYATLIADLARELQAQINASERNHPENFT
jgi:hypothetical protein